MSTETQHSQRVDSLVAELEAAQQERALARRKRIEQRVTAGEFKDREVQVGLKAFHGVCDYWAISENDTEAILLADNGREAKPKSAELVERISYVLRIHRLINEVIQGDQARHQRWIRRSNLALDGHRPIDLIAAGPSSSAKVMEYLEFCQGGHSA